MTPTATYRRALTDGEDVLFAGSTEEWIAQLGRLIDDAALRQRIGSAAHALALEKFGPEIGERALYETLAPLLPKLVDRSARRKRILLVNVYFGPQSIGGATRVAELQVRELAAQHRDEFEVFVLTTEADPDRKGVLARAILV